MRSGHQDFTILKFRLSDIELPILTCGVDMDCPPDLSKSRGQRAGVQQKEHLRLQPKCQSGGSNHGPQCTTHCVETEYQFMWRGVSCGSVYMHTLVLCRWCLTLIILIKLIILDVSSPGTRLCTLHMPNFTRLGYIAHTCVHPPTWL
jgi:hypothetical protein